MHTNTHTNPNKALAKLYPCLQNHFTHPYEEKIWCMSGDTFANEHPESSKQSVTSSSASLAWLCAGFWNNNWQVEQHAACPSFALLLCSCFSLCRVWSKGAGRQTISLWPGDEQPYKAAVWRNAPQWDERGPASHPNTQHTLSYKVDTLTQKNFVLKT